MNIIAAVDRNWAIGRKNDLLFRIRSDLRRFKEITSGNIVVCGRKTVQTFPGGKPLPGRLNIILSRQSDLYLEDALICADVESLFSELKKLLAAGYIESQIFVIGGASIYEMLLPYCSQAYITYIEEKTNDADCFLPNLDELSGWSMQDKSQQYEENNIKFEYRTYKNSSPKHWLCG